MPRGMRARTQLTDPSKWRTSGFQMGFQKCGFQGCHGLQRLDTLAHGAGISTDEKQSVARLQTIGGRQAKHCSAGSLTGCQEGGDPRKN